MVWDRLFGTHQTEKERVVFGVVLPPIYYQTSDQICLQFGYYRNVWQKFKSVEGFSNKVSALLKGPGWAPGTPRLGNHNEIPEPGPSAPRYIYEPSIDSWKSFYISIHLFVIVLAIFLIDGQHIVV